MIEKRMKELTKTIDNPGFSDQQMNKKEFIRIVDAIFYELFLRPKGVWTIGRKKT